MPGDLRLHLDVVGLGLVGPRLRAALDADLHSVRAAIVAHVQLVLALRGLLVQVPVNHVELD